ncbi:MAG TPA: hypothetical protein VF163_10725 [Micromonosporaceae bacterium]
MPDHMGRRRRQSKLPVARLLVLAVALVAIARLVTLSEPGRSPQPPASSELAVVPSWSGPTPGRLSGNLADGVSFIPRYYLNPTTAVGVAASVDGAHLRLMLRSGSRATELRRLSVNDHPQLDGFAASGNTLVWAESVAVGNQAVRTTIWRTNWRSTTRPVVVTSNTGEANFFGSQHDLLLRSGRVYWAAVGSGAASTEVRSVALAGGQVSVQRFPGEYALSAWPWLVRPGGRGRPVELVNLSTKKRITVPTSASEVATCSPQWCRMGILSGSQVIRFDLQQPDGSHRRRIAGSEATPTIVDVALLDRFVPLATDRGGDTPDRIGVGLSLYDIASGQTDLVAADVANVQGRDAMLWWSTGSGDALNWYAIDLRELS